MEGCETCPEPPGAGSPIYQTSSRYRTSANHVIQPRTAHLAVGLIHQVAIAAWSSEHHWLVYGCCIWQIRLDWVWADANLDSQVCQRIGGARILLWAESNPPAKKKARLHLEAGHVG